MNVKRKLLFAIDVRCRKMLDGSDVVDVKLYECTRMQYIESADDNRDDMNIYDVIGLEND